MPLLDFLKIGRRSSNAVLSEVPVGVNSNRSQQDFKLPRNPKDLEEQLTEPTSLPPSDANVHTVRFFLYHTLCFRGNQLVKRYPQWIVETVAFWDGEGQALRDLEGDLSSLCPLSVRFCELNSKTESSPSPDCRQRIGAVLAKTIKKLKAKERDTEIASQEWEARKGSRVHFDRPAFAHSSTDLRSQYRSDISHEHQRFLQSTPDLRAIYNSYGASSVAPSQYAPSQVPSQAPSRVSSRAPSYVPSRLARSTSNLTVLMEESPVAMIAAYGSSVESPGAISGGHSSGGSAKSFHTATTSAPLSVASISHTKEDQTLSRTSSVQHRNGQANDPYSPTPLRYRPSQLRSPFPDQGFVYSPDPSVLTPPNILVGPSQQPRSVASSIVGDFPIGERCGDSSELESDSGFVSTPSSPVLSATRSELLSRSASRVSHAERPQFVYQHRTCVAPFRDQNYYAPQPQYAVATPFANRIPYGVQFQNNARPINPPLSQAAQLRQVAATPQFPRQASRHFQQTDAVGTSRTGRSVAMDNYALSQAVFYAWKARESPQREEVARAQVEAEAMRAMVPRNLQSDLMQPFVQNVRYTDPLTGEQRKTLVETIHERNMLEAKKPWER